LVCLDEDDDLSEDDVSTDPIEGKRYFFLQLTINYFSLSGTSKGEKRKRTANNPQEDNVDDGDGPPHKI
jgi:hypothetical protein